MKTTSPFLALSIVFSLLPTCTTAAHCYQAQNEWTEGPVCDEHSDRGYLFVCKPTKDDPNVQKGPPENHCEFNRLSYGNKWYCA
ncbi:hypothetical protein Tdes44962_MAKER06415 [Teratosphaeria destructans]|uniref:Secreted protein n=1 Tax=Teratosphaeria destructans TaxID=418781 RepID=A0A9W7T1N1_9PEZI|nr:hypothetical protein Tdes44962_MAKER06415 [Teratosphaeria destructans]